jgi:endonuclease/exonuclease/phosphatase family metal-dependent hydrolase
MLAWEFHSQEEEAFMKGDKNQHRLWYLGLTGLAVVFGLQFIRVLLPTLVYYLRDALGYSSLSLAPIAVGLFGLAFLAGLLQRYLGLRWALVVAAGGLALLRVLQQLFQTPAFNLYLSGAGVALFVMLIPLLAGIARARGKGAVVWLGFGLLLGVAADTAVHVAARTLDLAWQQGMIPFLAILLLALLLLLLLRQVLTVLPDGVRDGRFAHAWPLLIIGPWLFLQLVYFQNVARLAASAGWSLPLAGTWIVLGNVLGTAVAVAVVNRTERSAIAVVAGLLLIVSLFFFSTTGLAGALLTLIGLAAGAVLLLLVFAGLETAEDRPGLAGLTMANGMGQLLFVLVMFLYYVAYDIPLGFRPVSILPVVGLVVALPVVLAASRRQPGWRLNYVPALIALVLLVFPVMLWLTWSEPEASQLVAENRTVRIINYNLHNGFNSEGLLDMEALAHVIEESGADVLLLQEVSRGWVINGSLDMLAWLSQRLEMPYVAGPTEEALWGNALLSRYPLLNASNVPLQPDHLLLRRGYQTAETDVGAERLLVINTHLHHIDAGSAVRQEQVEQILAGWQARSHTLIAGDFNATPEAPEMVMMVEAGLVDAALLFGPVPPYTYSAVNPERRIDYIWITADLDLVDFAVPQTTASDHLPLVVTVTLSGN